MKFESKNFSRSRHSRIRQTESKSSERDVSSGTHCLTVAVSDFLRKFNFLVRLNALADLSPITMEAGVLEYHLGSLSSLLLSSPRKESSI